MRQTLHKVNGGWLNLSKWHPVALPMRGAISSVHVQGGRWIQRVDCSTLRTPPVALWWPHSRVLLANVNGGAILKAAVALAAGKPDLTSAGVLKVVERFEA